MTLLCLLTAGAVATLPLPADATFELRWTHSVERTEWREVWHASPPDGLRLVENRVRGGGAGMEPAEGAELRDGWWIDRTTARTVPRLTLPLSPYAPPYQICTNGACRPLDALLPQGAEAAILEPCTR